MKIRNKFILAALALIVACGAIVLTSSASDKKVKETPSACCKKIEKKCSEPDKKNSSGDLILDNMSRQFISILFSTH